MSKTTDSDIAELMKLLIARLDYDAESNELFGDYLLRWFETYKKPKNVAHTSNAMYRYITGRIIPVLGDVPLSKIRGDKIQRFLNGIAENNTRIKIGQIIHGSLSKAVKLRLLKHNPFDAVEVVYYKKKHYRAVTMDEQALLIKNIRNPLYLSVFLVMVCTGLRIGEFLALSKDAINFKAKTISVFRSVDITTGELRDRTKTYASSRNVPFLKTLTPALNGICKYIETDGPITYNQVKMYFRKTYAKLGLCGITIHSFRHTFGCMCYASGISEKMIQRLMGHASLDVTMNVYVDVLGDGLSPLKNYFLEYEKDLKSRPNDFWVKK